MHQMAQSATWKRAKFYATTTSEVHSLSAAAELLEVNYTVGNNASQHIHITYARSTAFSHPVTSALKSMVQATENV